MPRTRSVKTIIDEKEEVETTPVSGPPETETKPQIDEKEKVEATPVSGPPEAETETRPQPAPPEAEKEKADEPIDCSQVTCGVSFVADLHKRVTILERKQALIDK